MYIQNVVIMLAYSSMLKDIYYIQNYAGIIHQYLIGLYQWLSGGVIMWLNETKWDHDRTINETMYCMNEAEQRIKMSTYTYLYTVCAYIVLHFLCISHSLQTTFVSVQAAILTLYSF